MWYGGAKVRYISLANYFIFLDFALHYSFFGYIVFPFLIFLPITVSVSCPYSLGKRFLMQNYIKRP